MFRAACLPALSQLIEGRLNIFLSRCKQRVKADRHLRPTDAAWPDEALSLLRAALTEAKVAMEEDIW